MFTGIIETTGTIAQKTDTQLMVEAPAIVTNLKKGSSIAVDGVCLTVTELSDSGFSADFMPETAQKTIIGNYKKGAQVNLELPMPANGRFEGHMVTGHVEEAGEIIDIRPDGNAHILTIRMPERLMKYVAEKGSVTINGISLTVISVSDNDFTVSIIPHTWEVTNLSLLKTGDQVNLETDILAKYLEKLTS
ncbi:riboflavin synthase [Candidatus Peregrinibacteria bacterium]|nr:riboflavin synthase [Candidatus Peregrinibacteria bacterium]